MYEGLSSLMAFGNILLRPLILKVSIDEPVCEAIEFVPISRITVTERRRAIRWFRAEVRCQSLAPLWPCLLQLQWNIILGTNGATDVALVPRQEDDRRLCFPSEAESARYSAPYASMDLVDLFDVILGFG